ncbi:MAG: Gfo/Idh/MocA family oxidoreductase [Chloroflexi bacterium]|nr:Gfo/Idh/MocA family oxidoreductase [Chloroflexota bacterium]
MTNNTQQRKVRVGVVGCGVVATAYYLPYLMRHADLVAVCDLYPERTAACARLFGAREQYQDYEEMLERADIEAVFVLTGPGTHARFAIKAAEAGKHILLQKPMATTLEDATAIVTAVRKAGVKALVEPSSNSPLDPAYPPLREMIERGVLGAPYWFASVATGPTRYHPSLSGNPYGEGAFYAQDSGGMLFDYAYGPSQIVTLLGPCKRVTGMATISVPRRFIVPESEYNRFLAQATDPDQANYWDVVVHMERTQPVTMASEDNVFCLFEMVNGWLGVFHVGRLFHPAHPKDPGLGLQIYGTEGNMIFGGGYFASVISTRRDLLPHVDEDGWYHVAPKGDVTKAVWPKPIPGGFNYYHASSQHLIDCILEDRDPLINVEWGRHITEMMVGAIQSSRTGCRYEMTTTLEG